MRRKQTILLLIPLAVFVISCNNGGSPNDELICELRKDSPRIEKVKKLTENGLEESNTLPLLIAAFKGHTDIVKYLVSSGGNFTAADSFSPMEIAVSEGHDDILEYFIQIGMDIDSPNSLGNNALHIAATNGDFMIVKLLLNAGADILKKNKDGEIALELARKNGQHQTADSLLAWTPEKIRKQFSMELVGTTWNMNSSYGAIDIVTFKLGGFFSYATATKIYVDTVNIWKSDGSSIRISFNNGYLVKSGTVSGERMEGTYVNKKGLKGKWFATRQ